MVSFGHGLNRLDAVEVLMRRVLLLLVGVCASLACAQDAFPPSASKLTASRSVVKEVNGDLWITANAYWDGANWQRNDISKTAFGLQIQGTNNIPGEITPGATLWVAQPGANPINSSFGTVGGWEIGYLTTGNRQMVVGGGGIEIDGSGSFPYARFIHNTISSTLYSGVVTNLFPDFSGTDSSLSPSWFAGIVGDGYKIRRAVAGSTSLSDLVAVDSIGRIQQATSVFSSLPACTSGVEGSMKPVTDSTVNTWGATVTGGGSNHVLAYCDGSNWSVMAK